MLEYIAYVEQFFVGISYEKLTTDLKTQLAVLHAITIIGEAANKIPARIHKQYPEIPWRDIINMRNRLVHDYHGTDLQVVWDTVHNELPPLKSQIAAILNDIEGNK